MIIKVDVKALPDDRVEVRNYRRKPQVWETGKVQSTHAGFYPDGKYGMSYRVLLDRRTTKRSRMYPHGGAPLFLKVRSDAIRKL